MIQAVEHPTLGVLDGLRAAGFPLKFSAGETGYEGAAAPAGTHNREILSGLLGLSDAEIDELIAKRSEEHTSELQSLMRTSYSVYCLKKKRAYIYNTI